MKTKLPILVVTITLASILFALDVGQEIELNEYLNARTSPIFTKYTKNIKTSLPKGTRGQVLEVKEFKTGNAGIRMKITEGPKAGGSYWVYYNKSSPQIRIIDKKSTEDVLLKQIKVSESDLQKVEDFGDELISLNQLSAEMKAKIAAFRHPDEMILNGVTQDITNLKKDANEAVKPKVSDCENCSEITSENTPPSISAGSPPVIPTSVVPVKTVDNTPVTSNDEDLQCTDVNLTAPKQVYHGIPTYNQEGSQLCYAFTAAQIIEGQRSAQGHRYDPKTAISPFSLAYRYALSQEHQNFQQGGIPCKAVEFARKNPICPASKSFKNSEEIEVHLSDFKKCKEDPSTKACTELLKKWKLSEEIFREKNPFKYVKAIEDTFCSDSDKIVLDIPACNYLNDESKDSKTFQKMANEVFSSKNPRPVQIGYSMNLISYSGNERKSYIIERKVEENGPRFSLRYKPHASILLGRRKTKTGQCQYLLRNTQGKYFCPIGIVKNNGWECDTKSEGIWINSQELFESVFEVSSIGTNEK